MGHNIELSSAAELRWVATGFYEPSATLSTFKLRRLLQRLVTPRCDGVVATSTSDRPVSCGSSLQLPHLSGHQAAPSHRQPNAPIRPITNLSLLPEFSPTGRGSLKDVPPRRCCLQRNPGRTLRAFNATTLAKCQQIMSAETIEHLEDTLGSRADRSPRH